MRRGAALLLAGLLAAGGCSGGGADTTTTTAAPPIGAPSPLAAVEAWVDGLVTGDTAAVAALVSDDQLAILIAIDNGLDGTATAQLVRGGISDELRLGYWDSFREGFAEFGDAPLDDLSLGEVVRFEAPGGVYAAVEAGFSTRIGSTEIIAREAADGTWQVDLLATIGASLVRPLRTMLAEMPSGDDGLIVRGLLQTAVPSLLASLERPAVADLPAEFVLEIESLVQLLDRG